MLVVEEQVKSKLALQKVPLPGTATPPAICNVTLHICDDCLTNLTHRRVRRNQVLLLAFQIAIIGSIDPTAVKLLTCAVIAIILTGGF